jgi:formylglycine-generating enzyme required for sulfatase activity
MKKLLKTTLVWFALITVIFLCTCKEENNDPDYDMTGTYTFSNTGGSCTWSFTADGNYKATCYGVVGTLTGTWSASGNDVTISFGVGSVSGKEVFTVQANGNQLTLTLKDNKAPVSNVLSSFKVVAKSVTLTRLSASSLTIEMVTITGGTFTMGSPTTESGRLEEGETQHSVTLSGFSMCKYQVTQEQYQAVMGTNPSYYNSAVAGESGTPGKLPVDGVSWYDTLVFCNKLSMAKGLSPVYSISGSTDPAAWEDDRIMTWYVVVMVAGANGYRLPTEAEWEYACRAGTTTAYNTGDTISDDTGWYSDNSNGKTHQVGLKPANAWGLYDMHGNVNEWCWDWYGDYPSGSVNDPTGAVTGFDRVQRGGHLYYSDECIRSAYRSHTPPEGQCGFRLVRSGS